MSWWSRVFGGKSPREIKPQRLDYLNEALMLERQGDYDAALTSYRLALRDKPDDHRVLQNMAIAFSKTGRHDEAVRCYRKALELEPEGATGSDQRPTITYTLGQTLLEVRNYKKTVVGAGITFRQVESTNSRVTVVAYKDNLPVIVIYYDSMVPGVVMDSDLG